MSVYFKFYADDTDGLYFTVSINGRTEKIDVSALDCGKDGRYTVNFDGILAYEFDDAITVGFERNGEAIGETATFSVNTYALYFMLNNADEALSELAGAIAAYGKSANNYYLKIGG